MATLDWSEQQNGGSLTNPIYFTNTATPGQVIVISVALAANPSLTITQSAATWAPKITGTPNTPNLTTFVGYNITSEFSSVTIGNITTSGSLIIAAFSGLKWNSNPVRSSNSSAAFSLTANTRYDGPNITSSNLDTVLGIEWGFTSTTPAAISKYSNTFAAFTDIQKTTNSRQVGMFYLNTPTGQTGNFGASNLYSTLAIQQIVLIGAAAYTGSVAMGGRVSTLATPTSNNTLSANALLIPTSANSLTSTGVG
ncbi:hypothetical protein EBR37_00795 [bacterium]|nr:hypothetical protein [bacterium]